MDIRKILKENNFRFNHSLGQNFITDDVLLDNIVKASEVTSEDVVVEIGVGAGTLTRHLADVAKRVISFEVDENLKPVLKQTLADKDNVTVIFKDVLKMTDSELKEIIGEPFKVVANLPYYITTPLIMRFLESSLTVKSITVMVQKEVADRLVATPNTADYGVITVAVDLRGDVSIKMVVDKTNFYPMPKVDSAVVRIDVYDKYDGVDKQNVMKLIKCGFAMRRKVLTNNLKNTYNLDKTECEKVLSTAGFSPQIRGEALSTQDYIKLYETMKKI